MGGQSKDPNKAAMRFQKAQMERLGKIDLPELQELMLESPELVGLLEAEQLSPSAMEAIKSDPRLKGMQMQALEGLQERAETGLTTEDKYMMEELLGQAAGQERSQRESIEQEMARRGTGGAGQELMMKLQGQQAGANVARQQARQLAQQAAQGKQSALAQMQQAAGQMQGAEFGRQSQVASAADRIAAANLANRQQISGQNLAARQAIANQRAALANQATQYNIGRAQQQFQNELARAGAQGGVATGMSQIAAGAPQGPSTMQQIGTIGGAIAGGMAGGPAGIVGGAQAGGSIGGMFADGGIAQSADVVESRRPADIQRDMQAEYRDNEDKQHNQFKKKYMKRVHDELLPAAEQAKKEVTRSANSQETGQVHAQDGNIFTQDPVSKMREDVKKQRLGMDTDLTSADVQTGRQAQEALDVMRPEESSIDVGKSLAGAGEIAKLMQGRREPRRPLNLEAPEVVLPENILGRGMGEVQQFANPFRAEDGAIMKRYKAATYEDGGMCAEDGTMYASNGEGDIIDSGMESFAGDRVDAKINDGEAVLNVPQQQRFMDLVRGKISVNELGDEDIVEGVPSDYRDDLHERLENGESSGDSKLEGLKRLLEALGSE